MVCVLWEQQHSLLLLLSAPTFASRPFPGAPGDRFLLERKQKRVLQPGLVTAVLPASGGASVPSPGSRSHPVLLLRDFCCPGMGFALTDRSAQNTTEPRCAHLPTSSQSWDPNADPALENTHGPPALAQGHRVEGHGWDPPPGATCTVALPSLP